MTETDDGPGVFAPFDDADFERFLNDLSEPFLSRDITRWQARIQLPFSMVTAEGPVLLQSPEDVQRNFDLYLVAARAMRVNQVVRTPIGFEVCDAQTVIVTYRTELLQDGKRQTDPYTSSALLHLTMQGWKMSAIMNARGHHPWTGLPPLSEGEA